MTVPRGELAAQTHLRIDYFQMNYWLPRRFRRPQNSGGGRCDPTEHEVVPKFRGTRDNVNDRGAPASGARSAPPAGVSLLVCTTPRMPMTADHAPLAGEADRRGILSAETGWG